MSQNCEGDVTKRVNARDENENNNTGFGVIRIQVASCCKSARAPLAGSDRYRYQYSCTGTGTIMIDSLHPLFSIMQSTSAVTRPNGRVYTRCVYKRCIPVSSFSVIDCTSMF
jgi:hypothetical protein